MVYAFNVYTDPWIPTVGRERHAYGIRDTLRHAGEIRMLDTASPLERFAIVRLLLAFIHWRSPFANEDEWMRAWEKRQLPASALEDPPRELVERFDLIDRDVRFFQDTTMATKKPLSVNNLFADLSAGTNINHLDHTYDDRTAICPACATKALVTLPVFCTQGGAGKSPSLNGAPPVYCIVEGGDLAETLLLNLPVHGLLDDWPADANADCPTWMGQNANSDPIGFLEGLTWQPRKVHLRPLPSKENTCSLCGADSDALIAEAVFVAGRAYSETEGRTWRDPHVMLSGEEETKPIRALNPLAYYEASVRLWRKEAAVLLKPGDAVLAPPVLRQIHARLQRGDLPENMAVNVCRVRYATSQMKRLDGGDCPWAFPLLIWKDARICETLCEALEMTDAVDRALEIGARDKTTGKRSAKQNVKEVVANFNHAASTAFRDLLTKAGETAIEKTTLLKEWRKTLTQIAESCVKAPHLGRRQWNPFERIEHENRARKRLTAHLRGGES